MSYEYQESYKHKLAKELLHQWMVEKDEHEWTKDFGVEMPFAWRGGNYGVHMELPFYETSNPYYFESSEGLIWNFPHCEHKIWGDGSIYPSWDEVSKLKNTSILFNPVFNRGKILFVPDICAFHKGQVTLFIEVVHTNGLTDKKIQRIEKFMDGHWFELYTIDADNILSQTNKKHDLKFQKLITA